MKKTLLYIAVFASVIMPSVTFAAWYNPLTWFKKAPTSVISTPEVLPESDYSSISPTAIPVPKPVITNTITVEDPKLQSQINSLIKENENLQTQVVTLTNQYNDLVATNALLKSQNDSLSSQIISAKSQIPIQDRNQLIVSLIQSSKGNDSLGYGTVGSYTLSLKNDSILPITINSITLATPITIKVKVQTTPAPYVYKNTDLQTYTPKGLSTYDPTDYFVDVPIQGMTIEPGKTENLYFYGSALALSKINTDRGTNFVGLPINVSN